MQLTVKVQKTGTGARMPEMAHLGDSGFDLFASETVSLKPGERKLVNTGLKIEMPEGLEAQVRPKSGLAITHGISVLNTPGTVDSGYRGEVKVIMANFGEKEFLVEKGSKIAQMVFARVECPALVEAKELKETQRNAGGFGSTGLISKDKNKGTYCPLKRLLNTIGFNKKSHIKGINIQQPFDSCQKTIKKVPGLKSFDIK